MRGITFVAAKAVLGASLVLGFGIHDATRALADESLRHDGSSFIQQPNGSWLHVDDATGLRIQEDDPRWSCVDDGDKVCGPGNANGVPAGCYDDGGVLVVAWPCREVIDPVTGDTDVYDYSPGAPPWPAYVY